MDEQRYREILPTAYMTAALKKGGKPSLFEVGLCARDRLFGRVTNAIWNRYDDDGKNQWVGKHMMLYKHNDPPKEGDRSKNGYRRVVYAEPLD